MCINSSQHHLLTVRIKSSEGVLIHVSSKWHQTGLMRAQQTLSERQNGWEIKSHDLQIDSLQNHILIKDN